MACYFSNILQFWPEQWSQCKCLCRWWYILWAHQCPLKAANRIPARTQSSSAVIHNSHQTMSSQSLWLMAVFSRNGHRERYAKQCVGRVQQLYASSGFAYRRFSPFVSTQHTFSVYFSTDFNWDICCSGRLASRRQGNQLIPKINSRSGMKLYCNPETDESNSPKARANQKSLPKVKFEHPHERVL